ncbi:MAG: hypothetical protein MUP24_06935 [Gillisia sp.]|nr:hypothetical protein [Gillisia sp.]
MKTRFLFLLLLFSLSSFNTDHKFYVSVTEIEYNEKAHSLQIISRVFIDDLEKLLQTRYDQSIHLSKNGDSEKVSDYIKKYLGQKMEVELDGKPYKLNYIGKEYENDILLFYLEIPDVPEFKKIGVKNAVLIDMFSEQKNLVHVEYKGETKSLILANGKDEDLLIFSK